MLKIQFVIRLTELVFICQCESEVSFMQQFMQNKASNPDTPQTSSSNKSRKTRVSLRHTWYKNTIMWSCEGKENSKKGMKCSSRLQGALSKNIDWKQQDKQYKIQPWDTEKVKKQTKRKEGKGKKKNKWFFITLFKQIQPSLHCMLFVL